MIDIQEVSDGGHEVRFQYKPWLVAAVKQIPGAKYFGATKHWYIPESSSNALINWAKGLGFTATASAEAINYAEIPALPELEIEIPLKQELFGYQKTGVAYSLKKKRLIIGDQPGLGKTAQAIATVEAAGCKCILIICPATIKENWKREIENKWTHRKALVLNDRVKGSWVQFYKVGMTKYFICNYESLKKFFIDRIEEHFDSNGDKKPLRLNHIHFNSSIDLFDAIIVDEIHRCKDGKTKQSKFTIGIAKNKEYVIALTGTPVVNKPIDLIAQLHIIQKLDVFGGYKGFVDSYCQGINQASNLRQLNYMLNLHCFYRREKSEVLKDLPPKMRNIINIEITNRAEYNKAENHFIEYLRENLKKSEGEITTALRGEAMVLIGILKKIAAKGKISSVLEHIQEVTDANEKIVIFAWHKELVADMKKAIPGSVTIVGDDSMDSRQRSVDNFQKCKTCSVKLEDHKDVDHAFVPSDTKVIICNIKSGGVGITLTASSRVGFIELPWHPADCEQCEDRCHRISQYDSVDCSYFLGVNTIDEYIYDIIEKKRLIVNAVTGSEDEIETNVLDEFINRFAQDKL